MASNPARPRRRPTMNTVSNTPIASATHSAIGRPAHLEPRLVGTHTVRRAARENYPDYLSHAVTLSYVARGWSGRGLMCSCKHDTGTDRQGRWSRLGRWRRTVLSNRPRPIVIAQHSPIGPFRPRIWQAPSWCSWCPWRQIRWRMRRPCRRPASCRPSSPRSPWWTVSGGYCASR